MNPSSLSERIDEQAARWTSRLDGGELTPADRLALHAWLDEDPAHRAAFEHYQLICDDTAESLPVLAQISALARPALVTGSRLPRWLLPAAGLAAAIAVAFVWVVPYYRDTQQVATVAAQRSTLSLPDGSRAEMNAQTTLHTDFRHGRRHVRLEKGEAWFSVAKDPAHPFIVETPAGTVRVTGTQFNVRLAATGRPEVTLLEGGVSYEHEDFHARLSPGQQISAAGELRQLSAAEQENVLAWRQGRIVLNGLTLAEAAARFAEFHGQTVTVVPEVAARELGGSLALDDLQGFFDLLSAGPLGLRVVRRGEGYFTIVSR
jgi:transmembrane sensor